MKRNKRFRIFGIVRRTDTGEGVSGLKVKALDKDLFFDDRLGSTITDEEGRFEIRYDAADFRDFFERHPDIYLRVIDAKGTELYTTEDRVRYAADDTEEFHIYLPTIVLTIGDTQSLIRHILGNPALLNELSESIAGPIQEKHLIEPGLAFTLVPRVYDLPKTQADLFVNALGPQPIPPGRATMTRHIGLPFRPTIVPDEDPTRLPPWWFWWWIGLPPLDFLRWLDQIRLSDIPVADQTGLPVRESLEFAHRLMADQALITDLSTKLTELFAKHGLVMQAGKTYVFTPVVYEEPVFTTALFCPQVVDSAARRGRRLSRWVNPIDGVMPPILHQAAHPGA
jgi:hypothetical protein